jgi:hypothetical protein
MKSLSRLLQDLFGTTQYYKFCSRNGRTKEKEETEEDVIPMIAGKKCGIPVTSLKTINDQVGGESSNELPLEPFAALEIASVEKVTGEEVII